MILLRDYQAEAVDRTMDAITRGDNPLIVLPCGSGKSVIQAFVIGEYLEQNPRARIICLSHVQELISQNSERAEEILKTKVGVYASSLKRKEIDEQVIFGTMQSVAKNLSNLGRKDLVIIDEAHLVPNKDKSSYQVTINALRGLNPDIPIVGLTGTPFRLEVGLIFGEKRIWKEITYSVKMSHLLGLGILSPIVSPEGLDQVDLEGVGKVGCDYAQNEVAERFLERSDYHIETMMQYAESRKKWIIFCTTVEHAHFIANTLNTHGITSAAVEADTPKKSRAKIVKDLRMGRLQAVTNVGVLTTGFDVPDIDMIAILRSTVSVPLFTQMIGRGQRVSAGKDNCLVLDFGQNFERFGVIENIVDKELWRLTHRPKVESSYDREVMKSGVDLDSELPPDPLDNPEDQPKRFNGKISNAPVSTAEVENVLFELVSVEKPIVKRKDDKPSYVILPYKLRKNNKGNIMSVNQFLFPEHKGYPQVKTIKWCRQHNLELRQMSAYSLANDIIAYGNKMIWPRNVMLKYEKNFLTIDVEIFG